MEQDMRKDRGQETDEYEQTLDTPQRETLQYFVQEANPQNGLVRDRAAEGAPASITSVGLGLSAYVVGAERGIIPRDDAVARTLTTLRFFWQSPQGRERDATGYRGFYYHFLDMETGRRAGFTGGWLSD
jgi:hypothetical protein